MQHHTIKALDEVTDDLTQLLQSVRHRLHPLTYIMALGVSFWVFITWLKTHTLTDDSTTTLATTFSAAGPTLAALILTLFGVSYYLDHTWQPMWQERITANHVHRRRYTAWTSSPIRSPAAERQLCEAKQQAEKIRKALKRRPVYATLAAILMFISPVLIALF